MSLIQEIKEQVLRGKSDCKGRGLAVIWGTIGGIMPCGRRDPLPVLWKSILIFVRSLMEKSGRCSENCKILCTVSLLPYRN